METLYNVSYTCSGSPCPRLVDLLFQPTVLVPLSVRLDIVDCDKSRELNEEIKLLPVKWLVPSHRAG
jgi:hypothetical protein